MHTGRLLAALDVLLADFAAGGIQAALNELKAAADQAAANPTEKTHQERLTAAISDAQQKLKQARVNVASASIHKVLRKAGLQALVGDVLLARLNGILSRTPFLLQQAAGDIEALQQEVTQQVKRTTVARNSLQSLGLKAESSVANEFELGILIPTDVTSDDLESTNLYLKGVQRVVACVHEITHGKAPSKIPIKSASSGTFELYLSLDPVDAVAIATIISTLVGGFVAIQKARKHRTETEQSGYPKSVLDQMKEHEDSLLDSAIQQATEELLARYSNEAKDGRINELKISARNQIDFLARSINRGVDVEVSTPSADDTQTGSDENVAHALQEVQRLSAKINSLTMVLQNRDTPIAELPEPTADVANQPVDPLSSDGTNV